MAEIHGISAYVQNEAIYKAGKSRSEAKSDVRSGATTGAGAKAGATSGTGNASKAEDVSKESKAGKIEYKAWNPVDSASSLIPRKTDYGFTIGDVKLSDAAAEYYEKLKSKFGNLEFIAVSKDMKSAVQANAAAYGNANKMVVLVDEEKLERMATDEEYRNKYEGIIAMASSKLTEAKNSLASTGANIKNFGMSVDENGNESLFATVEKSQQLQKERIEKKAEEKREQRIKDKKVAEEKREQKIKEKRKAEKEQIEENLEKIGDNDEAEEIVDDKEYVTIESSSLDDLINKVSTYSYNSASMRVMTEAERSLGTHIDFKG